ncbi:MAG: Smr/MutS family protein [Bacteroidales bacterium]|nr:Smr/MutS family protein [Bacteroidales bacterium]
MVYPENFEEKIGFTRLREMLGDLCESDLGKAGVERMQFMTAYADVEEALACTEEFRQILMLEDGYPAHRITDLTVALQQLRIPGTWPEPETMSALLHNLETIRDIQAFFRRKEQNPYPLLSRMAGDVDAFPDLIREIQRILTPEGNISDSASPALAGIRKEIAEQQRLIGRTMQRLLQQAQREGWTDSDASLSVREGRVVIPLNASSKRRIGGIVHDESASGKTSYIEPAEAVEQNNRVRELQCEERREIVRILTAFADLLRPQLPALNGLSGFLGTIDFISAKARLALKLRAAKPVVRDRQAFRWIQAIHPLVYMNLRREGRETVPLDIALNEEERILVISGPNAGGKSVCLKTVGLLQYMLQCGLPVPMSPDSEAGIFQHLSIDIGDEQSIDRDLSTYSSHLRNLKHFLKYADGETLLLIDEFGTGTEPAIGGAIAEAVLAQLHRKQVYGVITTHYSNLKQFALETEGIGSGAMMYDAQQMRPLFRLETGKPGSSFAFEMARRIGLPEDVLREAEEKAGRTHIDFERFLHQIERDRRYWQNKREHILEQEKKLDSVLEKYQTQLEQTDRERREILKAAKTEAEDILSSANRTIENTIRTIKEAQAEKTQTQKVRAELTAFRERMEQADEDAQSRTVERKIAQIKARQERKRQRQQQKAAEQAKTAAAPETAPPEEPLRTGDAVRIKGQQIPGEIVRIDGGRATIAVGQITTSLPLERLERISQREFKRGAAPVAPEVRQTYDVSQKRVHFQAQKDVRGMRADEALVEIERFIDEAAMLGIGEVRILHGKGNGILRRLIREYLGKQTAVAHFDDEDIRYGGSGIQVVRLK